MDWISNYKNENGYIRVTIPNLNRCSITKVATITDDPVKTIIKAVQPQNECIIYKEPTNNVDEILSLIEPTFNAFGIGENKEYIIK